MFTEQDFESKCGPLLMELEQQGKLLEAIAFLSGVLTAAEFFPENAHIRTSLVQMITYLQIQAAHQDAAKVAGFAQAIGITEEDKQAIAAVLEEYKEQSNAKPH